MHYVSLQNKTCNHFHLLTNKKKYEKKNQKRKADKEKSLGCKMSGVHCLSTPYFISQGVQLSTPNSQLKEKNKRQTVHLPNGKPVSKLYAQSSKWSWISRMAWLPRSMTRREQLLPRYRTSKSVENLASSLGPSTCPPLPVFPPAIVVTPRNRK
jgi:hypothetical protein